MVGLGRVRSLRCGVPCGAKYRVRACVKKNEGVRAVRCGLSMRVVHGLMRACVGKCFMRAYIFHAWVNVCVRGTVDLVRV